MEQDILFDSTGDLAITNGDFVIGTSIDQEVEAILLANKGDFKEFPTFGPNLIEKINANISPIEIKQIIKTELKKDSKSYQELKERINQNFT